MEDFASELIKDLAEGQTAAMAVPEPKVGPAIAKPANSEEKRADLGLKISDLILAAQTAKSGLDGTVWIELERMFRNEMPDQEQAMAEGDTIVHTPIAEPRLAMLAAQLNAILLNQDPYFSVELGDDGESDKLENCLHGQFRRGGFGAEVRKSTIHAALTNKAVLRVEYKHIPRDLLPEDMAKVELNPRGKVRFSGLKITSIHPRDFVIAPATLDGTQSAVLAGHRFYMRKNYILQMQKLKVFFGTADEDQTLLPSTPQDHDGQATAYDYTSNAVFSAYEDTQQVECYEVIYRYAEKPGELDKFYRSIIAIKEKFVLSFEDWPYTRPPYFTGALLVDDKFWGGRSVARNLYPAQVTYDSIDAIIYNGARAAARPPVYGPRIEGEEYTQWEPGDYVEVDGDAKVYSPAIDFDPKGLMQMQENVERHADLDVGVSTNSLGAEEEKQTTATQTQAIQQGAGVRLSEYLAVFTQEFPNMVQFACELLYSNYSLWEKLVKDDERPQRESLILADQWMINGNSPESTPAARAASLAQVMQMAMDPAYRIDKGKLGAMALRIHKMPAGLQYEESIQSGPAIAPGQIAGQPGQIPGSGSFPASPPGIIPNQGLPEEPPGIEGPTPSEPESPNPGGPIRLSPGAGRKGADLRAAG